MTVDKRQTPVSKQPYVRGLYDFYVMIIHRGTCSLPRTAVVPHNCVCGYAGAPLTEHSPAYEVVQANIRILMIVLELCVWCRMQGC